MDVLPEFPSLSPTTLAEAITARAHNPTAMPLGGGTDLVVNIRRGIVAPPVLIDMNRVQELHAIRVDGKTIELGRLSDPERNRRAFRASVSTTPCSRRRQRISQVPLIATWELSAAISASTPAAFSTIKANGGGAPTITA